MQINRVPGDDGILLERWLEFFSRGIERCVNILQVTARGIFHNAGPGIVGFAERDCIGVARAAIAAQGFVRPLGGVRTTHYYRDSDGSDRGWHSIGCWSHAS